jgi:DNA-binding response OmpR family regulator
MFKCFEDQMDVLGICVDEPRSLGRYTPISFHPVHSARRALETMRDSRFDLLLLGSKLPDLNAWNFLRLMSNAYPRQKWAMVGGRWNEQQRIIARSFGIITFFDSTPSTPELFNLITRFREQAIENVLSGRFDQPAGVIAPALAG